MHIYIYIYNGMYVRKHVYAYIYACEYISLLYWMNLPQTVTLFKAFYFILFGFRYCVSRGELKQNNRNNSERQINNFTAKENF